MLTCTASLTTPKQASVAKRLAMAACIVADGSALSRAWAACLAHIQSHVSRCKCLCLYQVLCYFPLQRGHVCIKTLQGPATPPQQQVSNRENGAV